MRIEQLPIERDRLGEGPLWDHRTNALYWVDHRVPSVRRYDPATGQCEAWLAPATTGCICLTQDTRKLLVALADSFSLLDLASGQWTEVCAVPQPRPEIRLSDGHADRWGGFVVGSAVTDFAGYDGAIYRLDPDLTVSIIHPGMMLSNAICFRADGRRMHFSDTRSGVVMACDYGPEGTLLSEPILFGDGREHGGSPDGATVDSEGGVWVAHIRTGEITRFKPDGSFDFNIQTPVPHATAVCFGGKDLDVLYVTTVRETGMQIKSDHPQAGAIFAIHDLGFHGVEEGIFASRFETVKAQK